MLRSLDVTMTYFHFVSLSSTTWGRAAVLSLCSVNANTTLKTNSSSILSKIYQAKKKNMCVYGPPTYPNFLAPTLNFFMSLLIENYLNTLFLPTNLVFDV